MWTKRFPKNAKPTRESCVILNRNRHPVKQKSSVCRPEKKTADNTAERMLQHLHYAMEIAGATEIRTSIGKFRIAKNPWSVAVLDESKIPEEFLIPQPPKVDKTAIMQRFRESGEIIDGCDMVRREGVRFR